MNPRKTQTEPAPAFQLDPDLWHRFLNSANREAYCRHWLALQCTAIPDAIQGVLVLRQSETEAYAPVARWPEADQDPERLAEITERAIEEGCGLLVALAPAGFESRGGAARYAVAYPVLVDDDLRGVIAVEVAAETEAHLRHGMARLQWGSAWIELLFRRQQAREDASALKRLKSAVGVLASVLSEKTFRGAGMALVTELATSLQCDRVSLAFIHQNRARIQAISHSAEVEKQMNLVRAIGMAMDEAVMQRREIFYPLPEDGRIDIVRDHRNLARQHGAGAILTLPFYGRDAYSGALTLERSAGSPFTADEADFCRSVAALMFPVLEGKRENDRLLVLKAWDAMKAQLVKLFGPRHLGRKVLAVAIVGVIAFFNIKTGDYNISANTVLEGAVRRAVVVPFDGFVKEEKVRAGDVVQKGALMCTLDDRDLRLKRLNWLSRHNQYQRQHTEAIASHNRAEAEIIKAQLDQVSAQLQLVEGQLARTRIVAPFSGLVTSGDLRQRLGGSVAKGEVLFEVAPLNAYRMILEVDERRIADVKTGQRGVAVLSALPNEHFDFVVRKVTPIAMAREGLNYFRVEARPVSVSERFRPGMEGIGKIRVDRRNLFSIWTRDFREWVLIHAWRWLP